MKASESFTRLLPSIVAMVAYAASLLFLALTPRAIPIGLAYAMWAGIGIVLTAAVGWLCLKQVLDLPAIIGLAMIVGGVVVVSIFSQSLPY